MYIYVCAYVYTVYMCVCLLCMYVCICMYVCMLKTFNICMYI